MSNNAGHGGIDHLDSILTIIILIALACVAKYAWQGLVWAFNQYVELLKVK